MKMVRRKEQRERRHSRLRQRISGTAERPRLSVRVTNQHIHVQFVDDARGVTLLSASTAGASGVGQKNVAGAKLLGERAAEQAKAKGIQTVVFDRGGCKYHGRLKALADAVRAAGIKF